MARQRMRRTTAMKPILLHTFILATWALPGTLSAQTTAVDLRAQSRNVDFSGAAATKPFKTGAVLPASCTVGESFFKSDAVPGQNLYGCAATNTWVPMSGTSVNSTNSGPGAVELIKAQIGPNVTGRQIVSGEGAVISQQPDTVTVETDTAVTPRYSTASTAPTGACQTGRDQFTRVSGFPHYYGCVAGVWKPIYAVTASAPSTCAIGEIYFNTADQGVYVCSAADTWSRVNRTGVDISAAGECFVTYSCAPTGANLRTTLPSAATAGGVVAIRVVIPHTIRLKRGLIYCQLGSTTAAFTAAIYRDSSGTPGDKIVGSDFRTVNLFASAFRIETWGSGNVILTPDVYWVGFSSQDAAAQYHLSGASQASIGGMMSLMTPNRGVVSCSNGATGSGSSYSLPSTCGTAGAVSGFSDAPILLSSSQ